MYNTKIRTFCDTLDAFRFTEWLAARGITTSTQSHGNWDVSVWVKEEDATVARRLSSDYFLQRTLSTSN